MGFLRALFWDQFNFLCICCHWVLFLFGIHYHLCADDSQIYLPLKQDPKCVLQSLHECLTEVKCWLANHFLQLNEDKTDMVIFGNKGYVNDVYDCLGQFPGKKLSCAKTLVSSLTLSLNLTDKLMLLLKIVFFI